MKKIIIAIVFVVILITITIYSLIRDNREINRLSREYPHVLTNDSINNTVKYKHRINEDLFRYSPNISLIHFKDGTKKEIVTFFKNDNLGEIDELLEINDRVVKNKGSDTVFIYKNNELYYKYFFIIDTVQY